MPIVGSSTSSSSKRLPTTEEVGRYVNGEILASVWSRLWLPRRVRDAWEERFPELARAA